MLKGKQQSNGIQREREREREDAAGVREMACGCASAAARGRAEGLELRLLENQLPSAPLPLIHSSFPLFSGFLPLLFALPLDSFRACARPPRYRFSPLPRCLRVLHAFLCALALG
uniref:Uncharacterized protein n=1 Tax=Arundo donax TaxID=35708 RepID=A0A0A9CQL6_ARUDO